jgi:hypothetical protein
MWRINLSQFTNKESNDISVTDLEKSGGTDYNRKNVSTNSGPWDRKVISMFTDCETRISTDFASRKKLSYTKDFGLLLCLRHICLRNDFYSRTG